MIQKNYNGQLISFDRKNDNDVMINATEMAKPFGHGKEPSFWLNTQQAKNMINEISVTKNLDTADLVIVKQGRNSKRQGNI